jgi:hypothetical protein
MKSPTFLLVRDPDGHLAVRVTRTPTRTPTRGPNLGFVLMPEDFDDPLGYVELLQQVRLTGRSLYSPDIWTSASGDSLREWLRLHPIYGEE